MAGPVRAAGVPSATGATPAWSGREEPRSPIASTGAAAAGDDERLPTGRGILAAAEESHT